MQIYDIAHDIWSYGAPIPAVGIKQNGLEVPACSVDVEQESLYVFGGQDDHTNDTRNIYKYDIARFAPKVSTDLDCLCALVCTLSLCPYHLM